MALMIRRSTQVLSIVLMMLSLLAVGCMKGEPKSTATDADKKAVCEYWPAKLSVATKMEEAFKMISDAKCKNAFAELEKLFDANSERYRVMQAVRAIGDRTGAVPILKKALGDAKLAKMAATLAGRWKVKSLRPQLLGILETEGREGDRLPALDALLAVDDAGNHEDLLIKLAWTDINVQDPKVNARALKALKGMKSKKAAPYVVVAAFLTSSDGQSVYQAARRTLAGLGKSAVAPLIAASTDKLEVLKKTAKKVGIPAWEWTGGQKIAQLLADTLDQDAALPLAKNMALSIAGMPIGVKGNPRMEPLWITNQKNRLNIAHFGLGHIGSDAPTGVLEALVKNESADTINQRLLAARSLAYIGTKKATEALFRIWDTDALYSPGGKKKKKGANALFLGPLTLPLAIAVGPHELKGFDERTKNADKMLCDAGNSKVACVTANLKDPVVQTYLAVVRSCKDSTACYLKELKSADKNRVIKAALILARGVSKTAQGNGLAGDKEAVVKALMTRVKATKPADADIRRFVFMALTRLGDESTGEQILELAKLPNFQDLMWKAELPALGAAMSNRGK